MRRVVKLLWMILIIWIVFFIIWDEKWTIKLGNRQVFEQPEETQVVEEEPIVLYKNSGLISLYRWFKDPINLKTWAWVVTWFLAVLNWWKNHTWWIITIVNEENSISSMLNPVNTRAIQQYQLSQPKTHITKSVKPKVKESDIDVIGKIDTEVLTWNVQEATPQEVTPKETIQEEITSQEVETVAIEKYQPSKHVLNLDKWTELPISMVAIEKYKPSKHSFSMKDGLAIAIDESEINSWSSIPESLLNDLLEDDEIDVNALESKNDEFLNKVFLKTRDPEVMNLVVETYLEEYQFVKAKKFIDSLRTWDLNKLDPELHLMVIFNSFALSSKTTNTSLTSLVEDYRLNNKITEEEKIWYMWIIALMQKDYDRFFELASNFSLETHKNFANKISELKAQTSKQMWIPGYYFDTLVSVELFNQWFFQPAKVLALSSLQQDTKYILPYQVLAYANFLTNSRDTSIEYLKKLADLDPNNAERYRFLMWIAYYWNEKYEQSVVMLSLIKNEKLRLDTERYLINDYLVLDQKNKLISSRSRLLWYTWLVASDFYTYFYEAFYHPYAEWAQFQIYAYDTDLADKMVRVCNLTLSGKERAVCTYWNIWKNIAIWRFAWLEESLLNLVVQYPQWYLYHALGEYYIQQWDVEKAKLYLLKAASMSQIAWEVRQIKQLLWSIM